MPPRPSKSPSTYRLPERLLPPSDEGRTPPVVASPATRCQCCNAHTVANRSHPLGFAQFAADCPEYRGRRSGGEPSPMGSFVPERAATLTLGEAPRNSEVPSGVRALHSIRIPWLRRRVESPSAESQRIFAPGILRDQVAIV